MLKSIFIYFALALCAAILLLVPYTFSVRAQKNQQLDAGNQAANLTISSAATQTPSPIEISPIKTPKPNSPSRPTPTSVPVPPPSDPRTTQLMVLFGILIVTIVIFGIWLNRRKIF